MAREIGAEKVQDVAETAIHHLSKIATIMATAARDIVSELGEMLNDVAEVASAKRVEPSEPPVEE